MTFDTVPELDQELINDLSQSVSHRIAKILERAILEGHYPPGHWLREVELAKRFKVSRTPLREAFHILESKGLIQIHARRGAFVKKITLAEMTSLLTVRECLDGLAASLAAEQAHPNHVAEMRQLLRLQRQAYTNNDVAEYHSLGQQIHNLVYTASNNEKLITIYQALRVESALYPVMDIMLPGEMEKSIEEHSRLIDAIASKDACAARAIAERHMRRVKTHLETKIPERES